MMGDQSGRLGREGERIRKMIKSNCSAGSLDGWLMMVRDFPTGIMIKVICEMVSLVSVYRVWFGGWQKKSSMMQNNELGC